MRGGRGSGKVGDGGAASGRRWGGKWVRATFPADFEWGLGSIRRNFRFLSVGFPKISRGVSGWFRRLTEGVSEGFPGMRRFFGAFRECGAYLGVSGNVGQLRGFPGRRGFFGAFRWLLLPVQRRLFGVTSGLGHVT